MASLLLAALVGLLAALPLAGQIVADGDTPALSTIVFPASAAAAGLGDAYPLATGGADVLFYHPGALGGANGITTTYSSSSAAAGLLSAAGAVNWFGGKVAIGLQTASYSSAAGGATGLAQTESGLGMAGAATTSETALSVGFAHEVGPVDVGVTGRVLSVRSGSTFDRGAAFDVGAAYDAGAVVAALSVQALGPEMALGSDPVATPTRVSLGVASRRRPIGPLDIMFAAALDRLHGGHFRPGGGIEISYWPVQGRTFAARIGYDGPVNDEPARSLTLGGALTGDDFSFDYAWGELDGRNVHRVGVSWR